MVADALGSLIFLTNCLNLAAHVLRTDPADLFSLQGECSERTCLQQSRGTSEMAQNMKSEFGTMEDGCICQCVHHLPVFREDLRLCVHDIHECSLVPFVSGNKYQKVPYVYLPMKGQIVYPSAEILFTGIKRPICVVSGANYLTIGGWVDLRNRTDYEPPFRLYVDEGRTFLQWLGESDLRISMEGRILLVNLLCKESQDGDHHSSNIFTPCLAFRAAGIPIWNEFLDYLNGLNIFSHLCSCGWARRAGNHRRYIINYCKEAWYYDTIGDATLWSGIREVSFATDQTGEKKMDNGYLLMALSSVLLGVFYITAIFAYLRSRNRKSNSMQNRTGSPGEEHVVKSNPLLVHCHDSLVYLNESSQSAGDSDETTANSEETNILPQVKITSALVHGARECQLPNPNEPANDTGSIECLPEENVSIVETLEPREERKLQIVGAVSVRRKLYFNPAYFQPELLLAPPPGAVEFLTKIREVMSFAKTKIIAKRFLPSLMAIPEESCILDNCSNNNNTQFPEKSLKFNDNDNVELNIRRWLDNMPIIHDCTYNTKNSRVYEEKLPKYELQLEIIDDSSELLEKSKDNANHYEIIELNDDSKGSIEPSVISEPQPQILHDDYEIISINNDFNSLPDLTNLNNRCFNSNDGFLSITLEESPTENVENELEEIEPDTLDRKPNRFRVNDEKVVKCLISEDFYFDSLERPVITLKTSGSFCKTTANSLLNKKQRTLNRAFGSLKDIFEAKYKYNQCIHKKMHKKQIEITKDILMPEERQAKRQRAPGVSINPPATQTDKPELNPTNLTSHFCKNTNSFKKEKSQIRPEDLGYLSTESNDSQQNHNKESQSDTDDSIYDGASESGAESTATDSFFFGKIRKCPVLKAINSVNNNTIPQNSSDTESNISLITVIP